MLIAIGGNNCKCPSSTGCKHKMWYYPYKRILLVHKRNEVLINAITKMNLKSIIQKTPNKTK